MKNVIYNCRADDNDPNGKIPSDVTVPLAAVLVGSEHDDDKYLSPEISKLFVDAVREAGRFDCFGKGIIEILVRIDGYSSNYIGERVPEPWAVFVEVNFETDYPMNWACVAEFYPPEIF